LFRSAAAAIFRSRTLTSDNRKEERVSGTENGSFSSFFIRRPIFLKSGLEKINEDENIFAKIFPVILLAAFSVAAQTTQFTYQGKLTDMSLPAGGGYDFQFTLTDQNDNPIQTIEAANVTVSSGFFTVQLDVGDVFDGTNRYLKIAVRRSGAGDYTPL
jgi:hypothetical protein